MQACAWLKRLNKSINRHASKYSHPYITFSIFGIITYPLYYFVWSYADTGGYENLYLRLVVVVLCVLLGLKKYWPVKLQDFFSLYWYFTLTFSLPFLFTFLLLKNNLSSIWIMNTTTVLVLCILLLDLLSLSISLVLGVLAGFLLYKFSGGELVWKSDYINILIIYGSILLFGALFSYRKGQLEVAQKKVKEIEEEKIRLDLKNKSQLAKLALQEKFTKIANQVAHDIRSPLASLLMIVKACDEIPEKERVALRGAVRTIDDIANHLLARFKVTDVKAFDDSNTVESLLVSATILQIITNKKFLYQNKHVYITSKIHENAQFAFIKVNQASLKRMLSNVLDNAAEATNSEDAKVLVLVDANIDWVNITVKDNGHGMSPEVIEKIMRGEPVTQGKDSGHGLGLSQVREFILESAAQIDISSTKHQGTAVKLSFPKIMPPGWIAESIILGQADKVVILDDDDSIHAAWDSRLNHIVQVAPVISIQHFKRYSDALSYINSLSIDEKKQILLLVDYELVKQKHNGLDLVANLKLSRAILVTSHYLDLKVQKRASKLKVKILPKQLASEIPILINQSLDEASKVDAVWVDDDLEFCKMLQNYLFKGYQVDYYNDPDKFLESYAKYPKNTRIYLDNDFAEVSQLEGLEIAKTLHNDGFNNLTLITGKVLSKKNLPEFLKAYLKTEVEKIRDSWDSA